jgi:replicative DNA helicase
MDLEQTKSRFAHAGNEAAVIACVLKDATNYFEVDSKLSDVDFLTPHHKAIWVIIKTLVREGVTSIDTSSILNQASAMKLEDHIGGYDYVTALFDKSINPLNIDFYIQRVADASTKLKVLQATQDINELTELNRTLTGETLTADTIVEHAQQKFLQISIESEKGAEASNLAEGIPELLQEVTSKPSNVRGLATGFGRLDEAINGLEPGTLTVLGARPKIGKSTILMNWAKHIAYTVGAPVLIIDTEMNTREQQFRLLSTLSGVPERQIKNGTYIGDPQWVDAVNKAVEIMESGLILHKYYPDFTPEGVAALTRKYQHQFGVCCLIFDYIKLPDADLQLIGNVKEYQALGFLCVALKNLAGQLGIPTITAAQIGRGGANKGHVTSSDFADSDRIFRYANTLLGLAGKTKKELEELAEEHGRDTMLGAGTHRLQILDTRGGGTNFSGIDLYFRKEILTINEATVQLSDLRSDEEENNGL